MEAEFARIERTDLELWKSLDDETDRGAALAVGAYFDGVLEACLSAYFADCPESVELLRSTGGLKTFRARLLCCRALRIIDDENFRRLDAISKIRNAIAHDLMKTLSSPDVADRIRALDDRIGPGLEIYPERAKTSVREAFTMSCFITSMELQRREFDVILHTDEYPSIIPDHATGLVRSKVEE